MKINLNPTENPNVQLHLRISLVKSLFRIGAGMALGFQSFMAAGFMFILAEALGIIEELV